MDASAKKPAAGGEQDASMEEILHSIRQIIAEDDKGEKPPANNAAPAAAPSAAPAAAPSSPDVPGSDVLELTEMEMVKDDASAKPDNTNAPKLETPAPVAAAAPPAAAPATTDVLNKIEEALATPPPPAAAPAAAPAAETPAAAPAAAPPTAPAAAPADPLLSDQATAAAAGSIKKLQTATEPALPPLSTTPSPVFQSGNTVENMVMEILRPIIKHWLDANLPKIVERLVQLEIKRLSK